MQAKRGALFPDKRTKGAGPGRQKILETTNMEEVPSTTLDGGDKFQQEFCCEVKPPETDRQGSRID